MKGSEIRKRYIVLYSQKLQAVLLSLDRDLSKLFRARRKRIDGPYVIFLTNQFQKDQLISFVELNYREVAPLVTSGTMKKCKKFIERHRYSSAKEEKEISALF